MYAQEMADLIEENRRLRKRIDELERPGRRCEVLAEHAAAEREEALRAEYVRQCRELG